MGYGIPLMPRMGVRAGGYDDLAGAALLIVTAGVNEAAGGATDRADPAGSCGCSIATPTSTVT